MNNPIYQLYLDLLRKHGPVARYWPQWCAREKSLSDREKITLGAILTQRTSWYNAHLALTNLKKASLLSLAKIANFMDLEKLTNLIRPAGFYQSKPRRLFGFCSFVISRYGSLRTFIKEDWRVARRKLLELYGIGPETADTILLYACDKPAFVIDEYTKRLLIQKKLADTFSYDFMQNLFINNLPSDARVYQAFHALIIIEQKGETKSMMEKI